MSVLPAMGTFIANLLTKPSKGFSDGMDAMGDFDPEGFVNANLSRAKNTPGTKLPEVTRGLAQLIGLGPKTQVGAPAESAQPTGKLDYLGDILKGLNQ